ncbi:MAG: hypothetical protein WDM92_11290 [Caulobacteraceae bacterium]
MQAIRRRAPAVATVSYTIRQMAQTQYANQNWTTGVQGVSPNYPARHQLEDRRRPADLRRRRRQRLDGRPDRPDRLRAAVRRLRQPDRRDDPDQGRAGAGDRGAGVQGPVGHGPGPGRPGHDPVQHGGAEGPGVAAPSQAQSQLNASTCRPPIRSACSRG